MEQANEGKEAFEDYAGSIPDQDGEGRSNWGGLSETTKEAFTQAWKCAPLTEGQAAFVVPTVAPLLRDVTPRTGREEIADYFSGALEGSMGLRSSVGAQTEGLLLGFFPETSAQSPEPGAEALEAARAMRRVEESIKRLTRRERIVLATYHASLGPDAPHGLRVPLGRHAAVCVTLAALEAGEAPGRASVDGEAARLRRIVAAATHGPWKAGARLALKSIERRATDAVKSAHEAYDVVHAEIVAGELTPRQRRVQRLRGQLGLAS